MSATESRPEPHFEEVYPGTDQSIYADHDDYLRDLLAWHREETRNRALADANEIKAKIDDAEWRIVGVIAMAIGTGWWWWLGLGLFLLPTVLGIAEISKIWRSINKPADSV